MCRHLRILLLLLATGAALIGERMATMAGSPGRMDAPGTAAESLGGMALAQPAGATDDWRGTYRADAKAFLGYGGLPDIVSQLADLVTGLGPLGPDDYTRDQVRIDFTFHVTDSGVISGSGTAFLTALGGQDTRVPCEIVALYEPSTFAVRVSGQRVGDRFELSIRPEQGGLRRQYTFMCEYRLGLAALAAAGLESNVRVEDNAPQFGDATHMSAQDVSVPARDGGTANPMIILEDRTIAVDLVINQIPWTGTWRAEGADDRRGPELSGWSYHDQAEATFRFTVDADGRVTGRGMATVTPLTVRRPDNCTVTHTLTLSTVPFEVRGQRVGETFTLELHPIGPLTRTFTGTCPGVASNTGMVDISGTFGGVIQRGHTATGEAMEGALNFTIPARDGAQRSIHWELGVLRNDATVTIQRQRP